MIDLIDTFKHDKWKTKDNTDIFRCTVSLTFEGGHGSVSNNGDE